MLAPWKKSYDQLDSMLKSRDITLPTKVHLVKAMVFSVVMYGCELDYTESSAPKNWCFWVTVLEKTLERPLDCKEIQPVHPKGNQSWIFIGRTDAEAEAPILWPPDAKSWVTGKDPDAGKDQGFSLSTSMGCKELDMTERLNWMKPIFLIHEIGNTEKLCAQGPHSALIH